ncbi:Alpha/beta hydrolase fold-1 [Aspergillus avenaceus]|uniref:Alpha/beta hydrolase fold-1 n=1 Tax=Aspergillus avenaceus TaxID=36643 RepID=A0A5N6TI14_ASPAV|nr:Alpha/beta hydrolase fold-1 [Aspergillus avenaceus]
MALAKPTIVIISGAWHTPASYAKLSTALKSAHYEVHVPRILSVNGVRPPNTDLYSDTDLIRAYVTSLIDAGREVIALMHSYGGQIGTNALAGLGLSARQQQGLPGGVSRLVYLAGSAFLEGATMMDIVREFGHEHLMPLVFDIAEDLSSVHRDPKALLVGPGVSDEELEVYLGSLERWSSHGWNQPLQQCAWRDIPVTYVHTTQDMTVPFDYQKKMVERMNGEGARVDSVELATGHCPHLTMPEAIVQVVDGIGGGRY